MTREDDVYRIAYRIIEMKDIYYRIALSFCGNEDGAMEAVSEMTLKVIEHAGKLKNADAFPAWSTQILINICRQSFRRQKRLVYIDDLESEIADPKRYDENSMDVRVILSAVKPIYREVIVLKTVLQYTCKEISSMLHIPVGTVQSRFDYGMKVLRKKLGEKYNEEN